jgi:hypothetical protein
MPELLPTTDSPETPDAELARLRLENAAEQATLIAQLQQRCQELEARLTKVFATVRSYLSKLHKQFADVYQALVLTFQGHPPMPRLD